MDYKIMFGNRLYIGIGLTIIGLFSVLMMLGIDIISDGDKVCAGNLEDPCVSYFNVTNQNYRSIYIYNYDKVKMDFTPEIKDYKLYVKYYGRWRYTNFTMETRLGNIPADRKYVFVFPSRAKKEFKLVGYKNNPLDEVKWGFGVSNEYLDPVWKPIEVDDIKLETIQKCKTEYWIEERYVNEDEETCYKENNTCSYKHYLKEVEYNKTTCENDYYKYDNEIFDASEWCCYGDLCGLKKDYDCNYIKEQKKSPNHSFKELNSGIIKIDDLALKKDYELERLIDK